MIKEYESEILETKELTPDVKSIKIQRPEEFEFQAGQYISINFKDTNLKKPYSIASSPKEKEFLEKRNQDRGMVLPVGSFEAFIPGIST